MAQEPKYPVQTVMKALELLNHLAKNTGNLGAGVSELSDALGIGKSTVHRLLDTLQYYGYIEKSEETNRYRLGWELYKVGLSVPAHIYGYRFRPAGDLKAKPIDEYRGNCIEGKAFQVMIDNNLCFDIALYPYA